MDDFKKDGFKRDGFKKDDFKRDDFKKDGFKRDGFKKDDFKRDDSRSFNPKDHINTIKELAKILSEKGLSELEIGFKDVYIHLSQKGDNLETKTMEAPRPVLSIKSIEPTPQTPEQEGKSARPEKGHFVTSPCVGTAYLSPSPEADPFVKAGIRVEKGQSVLIIEAMKVMNTITAPFSGIVKEVLVQNEQPVEFGQNLILIEGD